MHPQKKFHLVFSCLMGAMMISIMTFVITLVNVGWGEHFVQTWLKAFAIAYVVGVPVIFFWPRSLASLPARSWVSPLAESAQRPPRLPPSQGQKSVATLGRGLLTALKRSSNCVRWAQTKHQRSANMGRFRYEALSSGDALCKSWF